MSIEPLYYYMSEMDIMINLLQAKVRHFENELINYEREHPEDVEAYNKVTEQFAANWLPLSDDPDEDLSNDLINQLEDMHGSNYYVMGLMPLMEAQVELYNLKQTRSIIQHKN